MEQTQEKMEEDLAELAGANGYIVLVEPGFEGPVYHVLRRNEAYATMLSSWTPAPRCH